MAKGFKTGGRKKGVLNRRTAELVERLDALNCDPVTALTRISKSESATLELRARINLELLQYLFPRRKAVDFGVGGSHETPPIFHIHLTPQ
jgi:hypothetical protein